MRNFNKKKLVKVLRNATISASNAPPKTTKKPNTIEKKILDPRTREQLKERFSKNKNKVVVNKTQKGGRKRTKSMMDSTRAKSLGLK